MHLSDNDVCSICFGAILLTPVLIEKVGIKQHPVVTKLVEQLSPFFYAVFIWPQIDITFRFEKRLKSIFSQVLQSATGRELLEKVSFNREAIIDKEGKVVDNHGKQADVDDGSDGGDDSDGGDGSG